MSRIFERRQDSLKNGALWGLVGGLGTIGALAAIVCSIDYCEADPTVAVGIAAYAGLGAAAGVGIDALITHRRIIYEGAASHSAAVSLVPIVSDGRRGVGVSVKF